MIRGFVLAGGASRRMGSDKARAPREGWPMAAFSAAVLAAGGCGVVAIVRRESEPPDAPPWRFPVVPWARDPGGRIEVLLDGDAPDRHPLWGVARALAGASDRCAIAACDLAIVPDDVRALLALGREAVAVDPDGRPALFAVLAPDRAAAARGLAEGGGAFRELVSGVARVELSAASLANRNTPSTGPIRWVAERYGQRAADGERARLAARGVVDPDDPLATPATEAQCPTSTPSPPATCRSR